ncbi:TPA: GNAT family N-acetyltransferase [Vibrio parahaemolyticus]|nr:GNAT family N-acetyltransferase [Vibrio parahaemolyticus]HCG8279972.1 GNAT family N-acetyltransferase [Vibrio parahaemolyticus]HCH0861914.1 GNAT family N-acetyltransferase [Vibrio parahaemolyticus]
MEIKEISTTSGLIEQLHSLLTDCIESGASVGFLAPADEQEVKLYWSSVEAELKLGVRKLFLAYDNENVIGAVQLSLCSKANGSHRGEVEKLMVHTGARGKGVSKKLMSLMENVACELGLSLLVLDTRLGDVASSLYRSTGYTEAGQIPQFARSSTGELESTVYFFKLL